MIREEKSFLKGLVSVFLCECLDVYIFLCSCVCMCENLCTFVRFVYECVCLFSLWSDILQVTRDR